MKVSVRPATLGDAAALADLLTQLGYPSRSERVMTRMKILDSADQGLLVAEVGGAVVGAVHVNRWATLMLDDAAEIVALVVDSRWRGQGIGRVLLKAAEGWATQRGCSTLRVRTNIVRQGAHEFYSRNGYQHTKTSVTLVKELGTDWNGGLPRRQ